MNDQFHTETQRQDISALMDGELSGDRALFALKAIADHDTLSQQWQRLHLLRHYLREAEVQPLTNSFLVCIQQRIASTDASVAENSGERQASNHIDNQQTGPEVPGTGWRQQFAGFALAASVAVVALMGFNNLVLQPRQDGIIASGEQSRLAQNRLAQGGIAKSSIEYTDKNASAQTVQAQTVPAQTVPAQTVPAQTVPEYVARSNVLQDKFSARAIPVNFSQDREQVRQQLNNYLLRHSQIASGSGRVGFVSYTPLMAADIEIDGHEDDLDQTVTDQASPHQAVERNQLVQPQVK